MRSRNMAGAEEVVVTVAEEAAQVAEGVEAAVVGAARVDREEEEERGEREAQAGKVEPEERGAAEARRAVGLGNPSRIRISRNRAPSCRHFQSRPRRTSRCSMRWRRARAAFRFSTPTTCSRVCKR